MKGQRLLFILMSLAAGGITAGDLTPELFVRADLETRRATLGGMQEQIDLLNQGVAATEVEKRVDANRAHVDGVYASYGTTSTAHAAYGTQYRDAVEAWLAEHADWQSAYVEVSQEFERLAAQLDQLRGK